jgi:hypothetical protein
MSYLILCKKTVNGMALWWACGRAGYTTNVATAGRYDHDEAMQIQGMRGEDFAVPEEEIGRSLMPRTIVDVSDGNNYRVLEQIRTQPRSGEGKQT